MNAPAVPTGQTGQTGQTAYINPDIHDATGALRCAEGTALFVIAARQQIERLRAYAQRELGNNRPVIAHLVRFEQRVADAATRCNHLVEEHIRHARTQHELAGDANLAEAANGYLAARGRGPIQLALPAGTSAAPAATTTTYEIQGDIRGPRGAARAMVNAAEALGVGQASALTTLHSRLVVLGVEGASPQLLLTIREELLAVRVVGHQCAAEFARQMGIIRDKIGADPALRKTQRKGSWTDPANEL